MSMAVALFWGNSYIGLEKNRDQGNTNISEID